MPGRDVLPLHVLQVVQGGALDDHPAQLNRVQDGHRGQPAEPAVADADLPHHRLGAPAGELHRDCPPRLPVGRSQLLPQAEVVQLDDDSVNLVLQLVPPLHDLPVVPLDFAGRPADPVQRVHRQPEGLQDLERYLVAVSLQPHRLIDPGSEVAAAGQPGVELPDGAGRGVPRVREPGLSLLFPLLTGLQEGAPGHVDLAPDLQDLRDVLVGQVLQGQRQVPDGPHIVRHILALGAVAPGDGLLELPILVGEPDGHAINLGLDHHGELRHGETACRPVVPFPQVLQVEAVA